jgi:hypothetical protein
MGWKLPETVLGFPWVTRLFPNAFYIHWVRDPRDQILAPHITDRLEHFGVPCDRRGDAMARRIQSYIYQRRIVEASPMPKRFLTVRFEKFVLDHDATVSEIESFLGRPLPRLSVDHSAVGRHVLHPQCFPRSELIRYGYET